MNSSYVLIPVSAPPEAAVAAIRAELQERSITEYVVVDHGHDMAAAGATPHPAWTLIFGNPAAGEAVLAGELEAAIDIPLRLAVVGDEDGTSRIVVRPMQTLLSDALQPVAERLTGVLQTIAGAARDRAQAG